MDAELQVGVAVFGVGRAGSIHVRNVLSNSKTKLLYVVEEDTKKAQQFLQSLNVEKVQVVSSLESSRVLQDGHVKGVMICTPTDTHAGCVLEALRAGKAVFCEKPLANDVESTEKCYKEAARLGRPLLCSYNRRFDPGHSTVIEKARNGDLGTIHTISTTSRDSPIPPLEFLKVSHGIFHDCGTHDIDVVLKITGEAPSTVYAQAHAFVPSIADLDDVDCVAITLKFPSGILALINLDRTSPYGYDQRLEVLGDKAMMISDNPRPTAVQVHSGEGPRLDTCYHSFPQRYAQSYKNALAHFVDVIHGKAEPKVTAQDAVLACKVADACQMSYKTQKVVNFDQF